MLDYFAIFTKGGCLLWTLSFAALKGDPVNSLIRTCLLEERSGDSSFNYTSPTGGAYTLKWSLNNGLGLVFVAVYQKTLKLLYVDELLERVNRAFAPRYKPQQYEYGDFEPTFQKLLKDCESKAEAARRPGAASAASVNAAGRGTGNGTAHGSSESSGDEAGSANDDGTTDGAGVAGKRTNGVGAHTLVADSSNGASADISSAGDSGDSSDDYEVGAGANGSTAAANGANGAFDASKLAKLAKRGPGGKAARHHSEKEPVSKKAAGGKKIKGKVARKWDDAGSAEEVGPLDFTEGTPADASAAAEAVDLHQRSLIDVDDDLGSEGEEEEEVAAASGKSGGGLLSSLVRSIGVNVVGTQALTREDIAPALDTLKKKLMERNVAEEIAEKLCESVATSLEGRKLGSFTRVSSAVKTAVEEALTRILTPKRSIDILRDVRAAQAKGRPYVVVFVGVNGVGKSTNLAKVAYWLLQNQVKVMIAACDTFRSGAVEQLKTHCNRLQIPLYERGYEKDPAKVAFEATKAAQRSNVDVLLVDTAGRMQDNEPLMRALSNLINLNDPDLVLFVGEALVGNDAVDQLTKFSQRLADLSPNHNASVIDGIVLTKCDTIDDKVGAALSMVYTSGAPIMFVGCGQTYVDLKRLNVKSVVKSLLK